MLFIKSLNNILNDNLDKLGMNLNLEDLIVNQNNYLLVEPMITNSMLESMSEDQTFLLNYDVCPIGIIFNIDRLNSSSKKYFYTCLKSILNDDIQTLCDIENGIYFLASESSSSKIVYSNEFALKKIFIEGNVIEFLSFNELKNHFTNILFKYLNLLSEICIDDRGITKFIPLITSLKKRIYC